MTLQCLPNQAGRIRACQPASGGKSIVNRTLTRIAEYPDHQGANGFAAFAARNARKMRRECSAFG
jgi:hypothetical protein